MPYTLPTAPAVGATLDTASDRYIWSGSSWNLQPSTNVMTEFSDWSTRTPITITAVTTAPTKPATTIQDYVRYRRVGFKTYEVEYKYAQAAVGTNGSGQYLFGLPGGLTFDTSVHPLTTVIAGSSEHATYSVPNAFATVIPWGLNASKAVVLPYTSSTFRLWVYMDLTGARNFVESGSYNLSTNPIAYNVNFKFTAR